MSPDLDHLMRTTADAFSEVLHAVLDDDLHRVRQVLKGSAARHRLVKTTCEEVRAQAAVPMPQLNDKLQLIDDIGRIGTLVDRLARHIISAGTPVRLSPAQRMEVAVLLDAGSRRFRQLMNGPIGPVLDPAYRGCGSALFEVADHGVRDASSVVALCGEMAALLLQASRHATRAA